MDEKSPAPLLKKAELLTEMTNTLRRTHYAIVITCVAMILALTGSPSRSIDVALKQIEDIVHAVDAWDERWLENYATSVVKKKKESGDWWPPAIPEFGKFEIDLQEAELSIKNLSFIYRRQRNDWTLYGSKRQFFEPPKGQAVPPGLHDSIVSMDAPKTLRDFETQWNGLSKPLRLYVPSLPGKEFSLQIQPTEGDQNNRLTVPVKFVGLEKSGSESARYPHPHLYAIKDDDRFSHTLSDPRVRRATMPRNKVFQGTEFAHFLWVSITKDGRYANLSHPITPPQSFVLRIPLISYYFEIEPQKQLRDLVRDTLLLGDFSFTFAELDRHAADIKDLPLSAIKSNIEKLQRFQSSHIELLGLRFPIATLSSWGALLIVAIQIYFLIHMRAFIVEAKGLQWRFPWVGVYRDSFSQLVFGVSGFFLPVAVVCTLAYLRVQEDASLDLILLGGVAVCVSVIVSSISFIAHRQFTLGELKKDG